MMWGNGTSWGVVGWMMMGLMMVVFWGGAIALTVWIVRRGLHGARAGGPAAPVDRAGRELAERFARGEIDEAQFTRSRSVLHSTDRTP